MGKVTSDGKGYGNRTLLSDKEMEKLEFGIGDYVKILFSRKGEPYVTNVGRVEQLLYDDRSDGKLIFITDKKGLFIGYDLKCAAALSDEEIEKMEKSVEAQSKASQLKKLEKSAKKKTSGAKKVYVSRGPVVESKLDLENMLITLPGTRNFISGEYEILWPDALGVSRKLCTKEMKEWEAEDGKVLVVASWNKGEGHFIIEVSEEKPANVSESKKD